MNHKRKRAKHLRAGCLLCKPNKLGKGMEKKLGHRGFGKRRKEAAARDDLRRGLRVRYRLDLQAYRLRVRASL